MPFQGPVQPAVLIILRAFRTIGVPDQSIAAFDRAQTALDFVSQFGRRSICLLRTENLSDPRPVLQIRQKSVVRNPTQQFYDDDSCLLPRRLLSSNRQ